jgi:hypothetical protein
VEGDWWWGEDRLYVLGGGDGLGSGDRNISIERSKGSTEI